jgi:hypothetical protein
MRHWSAHLLQGIIKDYRAAQAKGADVQLRWVDIKGNLSVEGKLSLASSQIEGNANVSGPGAGLSLFNDPGNHFWRNLTVNGAGGYYDGSWINTGGGNPRNLHLAGQEYNGSVWSISKMNLLLHGIPDADMQNGDTLAEPMHVHGGQLDRFDRVLSNPPFSLNYTRDGMQHPERFQWGWAPEGAARRRSC